jgi:hypothetical protein
MFARTPYRADGHRGPFLQTKLSKVQAAMAAEDWPRAFSIASKFARLGPQRAAIMRAQAARLSPGFYRGVRTRPGGYN